MRGVLVDAGPLIALFDRSDPHHATCRSLVKSLRPPMATTWPVLTEAMHLLRFAWEAQQQLLDMVTADVLRLRPMDDRDVPRIRELMRRYRDLPMDLADATLVRVAERERITRVFTLDRREFAVYRPARIARFSIIP